ncbi:unnamed protein product [Nippostrongylus brasiliensis]|uniref:Secreted protein n=1 Tax=Nippostrongylus brasiliensis TaxID=27835 RepID=A0A0N4YM11_NIPBR|nr:unnamed protein product [Nippostrongylus brasiliensis]
MIWVLAILAAFSALTSAENPSGYQTIFKNLIITYRECGNTTMNVIFKQIFMEHGWQVKTCCDAVLKAEELVESYLDNNVKVTTYNGNWHSNSATQYAGHGARALFLMIDQSIEYLKKADKNREVGCATDCKMRNTEENRRHECALVCLIE